MQLKLENIGIMKSADVEIDGITVIAGENDTGKSTVGKVLYCIFNSFYNIDEVIREYKKRSATQKLMGKRGEMQIDRRIFGIDVLAELQNVIDSFDGNFDPRGVEDRLVEICGKNGINESSSREVLHPFISQINQTFAVPKEVAHKEISQRMFDAEFLHQINNVNAPDGGRIELKIKDRVVSMDVRNNEISVESDDVQLSTEAIYIDNPLVLDSVNGLRLMRSYDRYETPVQSRNHELNLASKLISQENENNVISEIVSSQKIDSILKKLNAVCAGELDFSKPTVQYRKNGVPTPFKVQNLSMGLKTFAIIKTLLTNGSLEDKGTIILDEPEIHLHPKWQLVFAELIVLIQKEFNMHILLSTHSPYFLRAIEVYAAAHGVNERCRYYLAENVDDRQSVIRDVSDNPEPIYKKLADPLQVLENERSKLN